MKKTSAYRCTGFDVLEVDSEEPLKVLHELKDPALYCNSTTACLSPSFVTSSAVVYV